MRAAGRWREQGAEDRDGRRLPGTVRSEEAEYLALADLEIDAADSLDLP